MRISFGIDPNRCNGCRACEYACRTHKQLPMSLRTIHEVIDQSEGRMIRYYLALSCQHCENPECFRVCPERTYIRRRDGIITHSSGRCTGCNRCIRACPTQSPQHNPITGKIEKCDLCVSDLDEEQIPHSVKNCPTKALYAIDLDKNTLFSEKWLPGMPKTPCTKPGLRLKKLTSKLHHFIKADLGGSAYNE